MINVRARAMASPTDRFKAVTIERHRIGAQVEIIEADYIDEAFNRVVASDVRYRFVIDASTFAGE